MLKFDFNFYFLHSFILILLIYKILIAYFNHILSLLLFLSAIYVFSEQYFNFLLCITT